jgi:hypothetical protein
MVSHEQIMNLLRRNADYNDMKGSTNGAGFMGGYASDQYGNFPQAIGGCGCCGGAYIGGAYIGGCSMCQGGAKRRGPRHCISAKINKNNGLSCAEWKNGKGPKKKMTLQQLYNAMNRGKSSKIKKLEALMRQADLSVPKPRGKFPKMASLSPALKAHYRECIKRKIGPSGKKRCVKYNILGKPPMSSAQRENSKRLGILSKLYSEAKQRNPNLSRQAFFSKYKLYETNVLRNKLQGEESIGYQFNRFQPNNQNEDLIAYGF